MPIAEGEVVCGTIWALGGTRDTDWYGYTHAGGTWTGPLNPMLHALHSSSLLKPSVPAAAVLFAGDSAGETCGSALATGDLAAETYGMFVAIGGAGGVGIFDGYPCNSGFNDYSAFAGAGTPPPPPCLTDIDGNGRPTSKISFRSCPTTVLAPSDRGRRLGDASVTTQSPAERQGIFYGESRWVNASRNR